MRKNYNDLWKKLTEKFSSFKDYVLRKIKIFKKPTLKNQKGVSHHKLFDLMKRIGKLFYSVLILCIQVLVVLVRIIIDILNIVTHSFIFIVTVSFLVIVFLLFLIFILAPHTAYVSYPEDESSRISFNTTMDSVFITNEHPEKFTISMLQDPSDPMRIPPEVDLTNCTLQLYDDQGKLVEKQEYGHLRLKGEFKLFSVLLHQSYESNIPITEHSYIEAKYSPGFINLWEENSIVNNQFHTRMGQFLIETFAPQFLQDSTTDVRTLYMSYSSNLNKMTIFTGEYDIVYCGGTMLGITPLEDDCSIMILDEWGTVTKEEPISDGFSVVPLDKSKTVSAEVKGPCYVECDNDNNWTIDVQGATNLEAEINGTLDFIYGQKPTKHDLLGRNISLRSKQGGIDLKITNKEEKAILSFNGEVSYAKLAGMDLFPSFGSWYRDEAHLIPLTLVTTIFSAVTLMQASKRNGADKDSSKRKKGKLSLNALLGFVDQNKEKHDIKEEQGNKEEQDNKTTTTVVIKIETNGSAIISDGKSSEKCEN